MKTILLYAIGIIAGLIYIGMIGVLLFGILTFNVLILKICGVYWALNWAGFFLVWSTDFKKKEREPAAKWLFDSEGNLCDS
jgi:hypothetical protein